jgi:hypothetical protein
MDELDQIKQTFRGNLESVDKLINFDREVQDYAIKTVEDLHNRLKVNEKLDNPRLNAERTLEVLKNIRDHDSLRPRYQTIFNQAVVLLVSYFGSAVADIFRVGLTRELKNPYNNELSKEELRLSLEEIKEVAQNLEEAVAELFIQKKEISFQDMQSIRRAFEKLGVSIDRTDDVNTIINNIIVGQACRHAIVHNGSRTDERLIRQVKAAKPRTLKPALKEGEPIKFAPHEIQCLSECMRNYVDGLCAKVAKKSCA